MSEPLVLVETRGRVGLLTLNRPKALNALNDALMDELGAALLAFDSDDAIGAMVITGSDRAFAAGADITAMQSMTYMDAYRSDFITRNWDTIGRIRKPVIAAVAGYALGGGVNSRCNATSSSPQIPPDSASPKSSSASSPAPVAHSACPARSAKPRRWIWC